MFSSFGVVTPDVFIFINLSWENGILPSSPQQELQMFVNFMLNAAQNYISIFHYIFWKIDSKK